VLLFEDTRNQKGWAHKMTRFEAKNDFSIKSGAGKVDA
jgi:hypothetical protein